MVKTRGITARGAAPIAKNAVLLKSDMADATFWGT